MSSFTSPLRVEITQKKVRGRPLARLVESFVYEVGALGSGDVVEVPAGFETDFASVPRLFWIVEPPLGDAGKAAVIHDRLYATRERSRRAADRVFLEAMGVLGVARWKRLVLYAAVRLFGASSHGPRPQNDPVELTGAGALSRPEPRGISPHVRGVHAPFRPATGPTGGALRAIEPHGVES